jgi:hypothetical protein
LFGWKMVAILSDNQFRFRDVAIGEDDNYAVADVLAHSEGQLLVSEPHVRRSIVKRACAIVL